MAGLIPPLLPKKQLEDYWDELQRLERQRQAPQTLPEPEPDEHLESAYDEANGDGGDE